MTKSPDEAAPIAGLRGLDHVGLTVPDMTQALAFFQTVLAAEVAYEIGPLKASDNWMAANLGVPADAVIARLAMVRVAGGPTLELFEYDATGAERHPADPTHAGASHLAFYVEDIDAAVQTLHVHGVLALGEVKRVTEGPSEGLTWVHFLAPWGQQLELVSHPSGTTAYVGDRPAAGHPGRADDPDSEGDPTDPSGMADDRAGDDVDATADA